MTKDEYDQKLKEVQEIEAQTGLDILTSFQHHDNDGSIDSAGFSNQGQTVFRQTKPFTPETTYWVDEYLWRGIVYRDPTR
jgi:hypothetical protein